MNSTEKSEILRYAASAPSGDNTQPWRFEWQEGRLLIYFLPEVARHTLDNKDHASLLSFGCLRGAIRIAAYQLGYRPEFLFSGSLRKTPSFEVRFISDSSVQAKKYHASILTRCTDRRLYHGGDLKKVYTSFENKSLGKSELWILPAMEKKFLDYLLRADGYFWKSQASEDTLSWVYFLLTEANLHRDGLYWKNMGLTAAQVPIMWALKYSKLFRHLMTSSGLLISESRQTMKKQILSSAGIWAVSLQNEEPEEFLDAGELAFEFWLYLNHHSYGVQPLTIPTLNAYDQSRSLITEEAGTLLNHGVPILQEAFGSPSHRYLIWGFRTGLISSLPDEMRARRKSIQDLLLVR